MFLIREYYDVTPGRGREVEVRVSSMQAEMAKQPGFVSTYLLSYLGNSTRYLALRLWESREASQTWSNHPFFQNYLQSRPPGLYATPPAIEYYEQAAERRGHGSATFVEVIGGDLAAGKVADFLGRERDLGEAFAGCFGFVERRAYRFLGNPSKFLIATGWTGADAADTAAANLRAEFLDHRPLSDLMAGPQVQEFYRVADVR